MVNGVLILLVLFGALHALRDYLQMKGVWNGFTVFAHFWSAPQYEGYSLLLSLLVAAVSVLLLFVRRVRQ